MEVLPNLDARRFEMTQRVVGDIAAARGVEMAEALRPVVGLAVVAHEGILGPDGRPLIEHCTDVANFEELTTLEEFQLGILHDAATRG